MLVYFISKSVIINFTESKENSNRVIFIPKKELRKPLG